LKFVLLKNAMIPKVSSCLLTTLLSLAAVFGPSVAIGAPAVTDISGALTHGSTVTVSGSGFGAKPQAAPKKWDTFENGENGATLVSVDPNWEVYGTVGKRYSDVTPYSGSLSLRQHVTDGELFETNYYTYAPATNELFVSYWMRIDVTSITQTILKLTRISSSTMGVYSGTSNTGLNNLQLQTTNTLYCNYWTAGVEQPCSTHWSDDNTWNNPPLGEWVRVDMYKKASTAGASDGSIYAKIYGTNLVDGGTEIDTRNLMTRAGGETWLLDSVLLGGMDGSDFAHDYYFALDDVYIDSTLARTEICDTAAWSARTHCEVQVASLWSDTSLTLATNLGQFVSGPAYLYVIDSTGAVNATGFPVTVGSAPDTTPPAAPASLAVD
jgi:hypothetical protein